MFYSERTQLAMRIATYAHHGQYDKAGFPYIFHPIHVAEQFHHEAPCVVALLHDVLEDTRVTYDELKQYDFTPEQRTSIRAITRNANEDYLAYINRLSVNPTAKRVKIQDMLHNLDFSRFLKLPDNWESMRRRYENALRILDPGMVQWKPI